jgi:hypothetical protein
MDLRPIGVSIEPEKTDTILHEPYTPVILKFDTEMIKNDTEEVLQISSGWGTVRGDKFWRDNDLYFVPIQGWTPGIRYTLSLMGTIRSVDGRDLRIERFVSFYAINRNAMPLLEWHSPANDEYIGTNDVVFEFHFSRSMDRLSVESAFTIEGIGNKKFEWLDDDKSLRIIPEKALSPWTMYRWNIKDSAKSTDGVPLPRTYSGYFTTDLDKSLPQVTSVFPVLFSDGCWFPTGSEIETGLQSGQGVAVEFNKTMGENVLRSLRFEPSLTGRTEYLSEKSIVYIFTKDPDPGTTYTLIVSGDTRDSEGLKIGADLRINFVPDIPYLNILSFIAEDNHVIHYSSVTNNVLAVNVDPGTGELFFTIHFSFPFGINEKLNTPQKITLTPFFPRSIPPVALQYVNWISDDRLYVRWEGLKPGDEVPHYYKLTIPGGKGGISSNTGFYMKEDFILYLEAIR